MKKAVLLHGTLGSPDGNWFRWLDSELRDKSFEVWLPRLPHADQPSLREWINFVHNNCPFPLDEETVLIGHSSGATLCLAVANETTSKLGAIVAVAPFVPVQEPYVGITWDANARLFDVDIKLESIKNNVSMRLVVYSDDDPYIPLTVSKYIAEQSEAEAMLLSDQGHFNLEQSDDYQKFPTLLGLLMERGIVAHGTIQIVDENDVPIRGGTMQEAQSKGLWHRIVRVMVEDENGNVLLQKRAPTMLMSPNCWDCSSSGHVDVGEDWLRAAERELSEEIGLESVKLAELQRYKREIHKSDGRIFRRFNVAYRTAVPRDTVLTPQPEEISEVRWFSPGELRRLVAEHPGDVTHGLTRITKDFYENN